MSQTLTKVLLHVVLSTKNRDAFISTSMESGLYSYIGGVCRNLESPLLAAGGTANHIHLLIAFGRSVSMADLVMHLKKDSSRWAKANGCAGFRWQEGYGAFSIGGSQRRAVVTYIARQKEHHLRMSYEDEFLALLRKYAVEYDPRYIWT